uniref:Uncharacterized protein n=1 Tax=Rousettus aegyptiacus TaxID=9407 RepID=A0A7J8DI77_ROUAE|nr:hypothetical protein HJG63_008676 [Rousettus aegyptiacus]
MTGQTDVKPGAAELHQKRRVILTGLCGSGDTGALPPVVSGGTRWGSHLLCVKRRHGATRLPETGCGKSRRRVRAGGTCGRPPRKATPSQGLFFSLQRTGCMSVGRGRGGGCRWKCPETLRSEKNHSFLSPHVA